MTKEQIYNKQYRIKNAKRLKVIHRMWYLKNMEEVKKKEKEKYADKEQRVKKLQSNRDSNFRRKVETIYHYSNGELKCKCCSENIIQFLTIDHIEKIGYKNRVEQKHFSGSRLYNWLKKNKYPKGFQVLCFNCNCAKGHYGKCPHSI